MVKKPKKSKLTPAERKIKYGRKKEYIRFGMVIRPPASVTASIP